MSTATTTTTKATMPEQGLLPLKASFDALPAPNSLSPSSAEATLQSLYTRAAHAFLYRDLVLAATLVESAFTILRPPVAPTLDSLDPLRRKWDILRITLESMVYTSPPDRATLPMAMRELLLQSPQSFVTTSHTRSLALFTPSSLPRASTSAFLPQPVLVTHVASSLNANCPEVGREITENWLSARGQIDFVPSTGEEYHKVLELYCLHILPRMEEWAYAKEFLAYEVELPLAKRTELQRSLEAMHARSLTEKASSASAVAPPRFPSPAPSASSSSSSLSTISNRTAVPLTRTGVLPSKLNQRQRSRSSSSASSDATLTRRNSRDPRFTPRASPRVSRVRGSPSSAVTTTGRSRGTLASIRESLCTYLTTNRLTALTILFFLLPVLSFVIRLRRARAVPPAASAADQVKRRLFDARGGSILHKLWGAVGRAVWDAVQMGGGGLV